MSPTDALSFASHRRAEVKREAPALSPRRDQHFIATVMREVSARALRLRARETAALELKSAVSRLPAVLAISYDESGEGVEIWISNWADPSVDAICLAVARFEKSFPVDIEVAIKSAFDGETPDRDYVVFKRGEERADTP